MKTCTQHSIAAFLLAGAMLCGTLFSETSRAEMTDREFETELHQERRDFDKYLKSHVQAPEVEQKAGEALREARKKEEVKRLEVLAEYTRKMKRYSMEEIEAKDRADEERIAKDLEKKEDVRTKFVGVRNRRREIEARAGQIDTYREFDIDMTQEPESKVSHTGSSAVLGAEGL